MTTDPRKSSMTSLILTPALITLAVTVLRLVGELQNWSPRFFSRQAGGAGAVVGIVWLVPIFGTRRRANVASNIEAAALVLSPGELAALEEAAPRGATAGERWPQAFLEQLDR